MSPVYSNPFTPYQFSRAVDDPW